MEEIYKIADEEGWDSEQVLEMAFAFLTLKGEDESFIDYLKEKAIMENEEIYDENHQRSPF